MPSGKGTYGKKVGRPPKKKATKKNGVFGPGSGRKKSPLLNVNAAIASAPIKATRKKTNKKK
tara:strand:- start:1621 stop:1806 length:186 start_codon:yes stop_codon:yes gene_type:complete